MPLSQTLLSYFDQYRAGTLPPEERSLLFQSLEDDSLAEDWKAYLLLLAQSAPGDANYHPEDWQEMLQAILQQPQERKPVRRLFWAIAAAAMVILSIGGAIWLLNPSPQQPKPVAIQNTPHDTLPGGNKAVLTLANG
ncbi:MAG: hypothetical protein JST39_14080, partial [Bacteroidetes bacterium]|nr:hypothetical protein [Bacteroidota bacterium]